MPEPVGFVTVEYPDGSRRTDLTRLTDGRVMCCLCFSYVTRDRLSASDIPGVVTDVCQDCRTVELAEMARRGLGGAL